MACLSIKYYCGTLKWLNTYNAPLLWSRERVGVDYRRKTKPFSCVTMSDENWSRKEQCTTDDMSTISAGVPVILPFLARYIKEFEKKSCSSKSFGFSSTNYHLTEYFLMFFIAYFILSGSNSSVEIISIFAENDFSPWRDIFTNVLIFSFKYVNKFENRLYIYKYDWKDLNEFFRSGLWLIL